LPAIPARNEHFESRTRFSRSGRKILWNGEFRENDHLSGLTGKTPCGATGNQLSWANETGAAEQLNLQCVFEQMRIFFQAAFVNIIKVKTTCRATSRM
jgi:hypothetical protein